MFNVFKGALLTLMRDRSVLIWSLAFPLIISMMFVFMFSNMDEAGQFEPISTAVVVDEHYDAAPGFSEMIDALSEPGDNQLLEVVRVSTEQEARDLMSGSKGDEEGSSGVLGYFTVDAAGKPTVHVKAGAEPDSLESAYQSILATIGDGYVRNAALIKDIAVTNPTALADAAALEKMLDTASFTEKIDVTQNPPKESVRYFFALLGFTTLMGGQIGLIAICRAQPNLSAIGARRAVAGLNRARTLAATFAASWLISFACITITFLFIRFVAGVDFGGRDALCIAVIAAAAFVATALGTLLGSLPKIPESTKGGMLSAIACFASLFAGLYGPPSMRLADAINTAVPAAQLINPAAQISQTFFTIMYYDTGQRTFEHIAALLAMALVLFAASIVFMRRQRYASI